MASLLNGIAGLGVFTGVLHPTPGKPRLLRAGACAVFNCSRGGAGFKQAGRRVRNPVVNANPTPNFPAESFKPSPP